MTARALRTIFVTTLVGDPFLFCPCALFNDLWFWQVVGVRGLRAARLVGAVPGPFPATALFPNRLHLLLADAMAAAWTMSVAKLIVALVPTRAANSELAV
jgi:hypothetical protein